MACLQIIGLSIELIPTFLLGITAAYGLMILWLAWGWSRIKPFVADPRKGESKVSVLIAVRNEEERLPLLMSDLENQDYSGSLFEIILIDDHSDKAVDTLPCVRKSDLQSLIVHRLPPGKEGKKCALLAGAALSNSELFLFTDADCRVNPGWIRSMVSFYELTKADLIIGLVDQLTNPTCLSHFFRLDFLSLIASGAGSAGQNHPTLCNGANLAVRRDLFLKNSAHLKLKQVSGDDVFLLHAIKRSADHKIAVLKCKESVVLTEGPSGPRQFIAQRLRWASKSSSYKDWVTLMMSLLVLLFNILLIAACLGAIAGLIKVYVLIIMESVKLLVDYILLHRTLKFFGKRKSLLFLPVFQIIYPLYILGVAGASFFSPVSWKNRSFLLGKY